LLRVAEVGLIAQASDFKGDPLSHLRNAERMFASIGWIEGQARVLEQRARHYVGIAKREDNLRIAKMLLGEAK
jgi:hypothetical protein